MNVTKEKVATKVEHQKEEVVKKVEKKDIKENK